jgi:hypothetical protein
MLSRFIGHALTFLFVCLPLMLAGVVILLFVCPFMAKDRLRLPYIFRWWDIVDDWIGRDTSVIQAIYAKGWWSRYVYCAFRNPINFLGYAYLGLHWNSTEIYTRYNPAEDYINTGNMQGFRHIEVLQGDGTQPFLNKAYYEYCLVWVYPFAKPYCLYARCGWKIVNKNNPAGTVSQWCLTINPFCTFTGKL